MKCKGSAIVSGCGVILRTTPAGAGVGLSLKCRSGGRVCQPLPSPPWGPLASPCRLCGAWTFQSHSFGAAADTPSAALIPQQVVGPSPWGLWAQWGAHGVGLLFTTQCRVVPPECDPRLIILPPGPGFLVLC